MWYIWLHEFKTKFVAGMFRKSSNSHISLGIIQIKYISGQVELASNPCRGLLHTAEASPTAPWHGIQCVTRQPGYCMHMRRHSAAGYLLLS